MGQRRHAGGARQPLRRLIDEVLVRRRHTAAKRAIADDIQRFAGTDGQCVAQGRESDQAIDQVKPIGAPTGNGEIKIDLGLR